MNWPMKSAEAFSATSPQPSKITEARITRTLMLGVHLAKKVWIAVTIDSTAPYRLSALWLMMLSRNNTIRIGPNQPVACLTASIASVPSGTHNTATAPKLKHRMVPRVAPK
ncbi:hypothetical protein D3C81_1826220 [compost metagenome]